MLRERFGPLRGLVIAFLLIATLTRIALYAATPGAQEAGAVGALFVFGVGLGYDLLALLYFAIPLVLLLAATPQRLLENRGSRSALALASGLMLYVLLWVAVAEWVFWDEFQARFNFIAVDYLVYTHEVIGNIRESYPVGLIASILAALALLGMWALRGTRRLTSDTMPPRQRLAVAVAWIALAGLGSTLVSGSQKDVTSNQYVNELAGNGIYQFFSAYRHAQLDFDRYYVQRPMADAFAIVRSELAVEPDAHFLASSGIERRITPRPQPTPLNVVLISVESLSAEYSGTYGRAPSLTPQLDALSSESLVFDRLQASGTRTVRGLEALALSVPPTPGESIVKRPDNTGLFTVASAFDNAGYRSMFLYGGYGAFDNMSAFFAGNGYEVHDRTDIRPEGVHHENVWGVADEDLYTMALDRFDRSAAEGRPFFAHLMTTSNHRPYTFPAGRGPWPQGKRESAVAYTDWAIGDFLDRARSHGWFRDTVFVITADHCASSGGLAALSAFRYHIPMWIHAPGRVAAGHYTKLMAQVDIAPTLLGLAGITYDSPFYGIDVLGTPAAPERAYIGTYQLLGRIDPQRLVELSPNRGVRTVLPNWHSDVAQPEVASDPQRIDAAIAAYQTAAWRFSHGAMREKAAAPRS